MADPTRSKLYTGEKIAIAGDWEYRAKDRVVACNGVPVLRFYADRANEALIQEIVRRISA